MFLFFLLLFLAPVASAQEPGTSEARMIEDQVWKVEIEGNETFSDIVIKQIIATEGPTFWKKIAFWSRGGNELDELEIRRDVIRIRRYYERRGFADISVSYRIETGNKEWKKEVHFIIDENVPIRISDISYTFEASGNFKEYITESSAFRRVQRRSQFQIGSRYQTIAEPEVVGQFSKVLKNLGFAFSEVELHPQVDTTRNSASVVIHIIPGPITYFDDVTIQGNETISDNHVIKESGIKKGEQFEQDKLEQAQREIFNHHLFRFATINIPSQEKDSTVAVNINVREKPLRSFQVLLGVGTEDIVRGQVSWTHRNAFKKGHRFTVTGQGSFIEQSLNFDYLFPYVFNPKSSFVVSPFAQHILERRIFELFHWGVTNSFIYSYRQDLTGTVSYQFTRNMELTQNLENALPDTTFEYNLSSFQLSGYYNPGFSRRGQEGWVVQPYAEFSGLFGAAAFAFQKYSIDVRRFTKLTGSTTLATRIQAGGIYDVAQDSLPQNIRYYLGGTSSIRGWNRNELGPKRARFDSTGAFANYAPVGGRIKFGFNAEIRQQLDFFIKGLGMAVFLDGGQIWRDPKNLDARPIQFGFGGGLRYRSPIGPVRIDVGYKLNPTDEDLNIYQGENYGNNWDRIGIHFSIGQAF